MISRHIDYIAFHHRDGRMYSIKSIFLGEDIKTTCGRIFEWHDIYLCEFSGVVDIKYNKIYEGDYVQRAGKVYIVVHKPGMFVAESVDDKHFLPMAWFNDWKRKGTSLRKRENYEYRKD